MHKTREAIDQQQAAEMIANHLNKIEHPILFNTEMIKAILEGHKTMTRRLLKSIEGDNFRFERIWQEDGEWLAESKSGLIYKGFIKCPYGKKGDILWVRETFTEWPKGEFQYKASAPNGIESGIWKPSIHMPKSAARIWLRIKDIRIERLHDISEEDIIREGIRLPVHEGKVCFIISKDNSAIHFMPSGCLSDDTPDLTTKDYFFAFWAELWCKIHGRKSWDENPFIWVIEFEVLSTTGNNNYDENDSF